MGFNEDFQKIAIWCAEKAGHWTHFTIWFILLAIWIAIGPLMHWSDSWQLIANTPTTWYELFLGLAILVDGAAQIKMLMEINEKHVKLEEHILRLEQKIAINLGIEDK